MKYLLFLFIVCIIFYCYFGKQAQIRADRKKLAREEKEALKRQKQFQKEADELNKKH